MVDTPVKPIRKTHKFYNTSGNLWDNEYRTSPKVAKFYHRVNHSFVETNHTLKANQTMVEDAERAREGRANSLLRQRIRKAERLALEAKAKGRSDSLQSSPQGRALRSSHTSSRPQVPINEWERLDHLPRQKLTQFITQKCIEMDEWAKDSLLDIKRKKAESLLCNRDTTQRRREQQREALLTRHSELSALEEKSGVIKLRSRNCRNYNLISTPFGVGRSHLLSSRVRSLSRPKAEMSPKNPLEYSEMKGLMVVNHPVAVEKVKRSQSNIHPRVEPSAPHKHTKVETLSEAECKQLHQELDHFTDALQVQTKGFCRNDLEAALKADRKLAAD